MCVDQLIKLNAKLQQARLFTVDELGITSRNNPSSDEDVDKVWQLRFKDGARFIFDNQDAAQSMAASLRAALHPVIEEYRQLLYKDLSQALLHHNVSRIDNMVTWLEALQKDPVVVIPEATCRQIVGLDSSWVAYVDIGDDDTRTDLRTRLQHALDSVMKFYIHDILKDMREALCSRT